MVLLVLLFSLVIDRTWTAAPAWRSFDAFSRYCARLSRGLGPARLWDGPLGLVVVLLFPLLVLVLVQQLFAAVLSLLAFLFAVAVLTYSLGPCDLDKDVQRFLNAWALGDEPQARAAAHDIVGIADLPAGHAALGRAVIEGVVVAGHERLLGVMFWFCVLRNNNRGREVTSGFAVAVVSLHAILGWGPSRLAALCYGLMGNFAEALHRWRDEAPLWRHDWPNANRRVLVASGIGALQLDQDGNEDDFAASSLQVRAALALVWRTVVLAVSLVALVTLGGWVSYNRAVMSSFLQRLCRHFAFDCSTHVH